MRRKFLLPALAACAMLAVGAPVASAAKAHTASRAHVAAKSTAISFALTAIKNLQSKVGALQDIASGFKDGFARLDFEVGLIIKGVPDIKDALTKLGDAAKQLGDGLTAVNAALQNPTTGLVGLNNARPQFGAYGSDGSFLGGTGAVTGAKGPKAAAVHNATGKYLVDFGNDVSSRFLVVTLFPSATAPIGQAVSCASSAATATCNALNGSTIPTPANVVLVTTEDHSGSVPDAGTIAAANASFEVAAISG